MSSTTLSASKASEFPVHWDDPADEQRTFMIDLMHSPHPISPLAQTIRAAPYGMAAAAEELGLPHSKADTRYVNYYQFRRQESPEPESPDKAEARENAIEDTMRRETGRLGERWRDEHLPRIRQLIGEMERIEAAIPSASLAGIVAMMDELVPLTKELWTIHFRVAFPMLTAIQAYDEFYADLFGGVDADAHALLVGRPSMSVQAGIGLSDLANEAHRAGLDKLLIESPLDEIMLKLGSTAEGRAFLGRLEEYLQAFGLRQDLFDVMVPTWRENPSIALASIRAYLMNGHDPRAEHAARQQSAEIAAAEAREQLASYPAPVRAQFEAMLQSARDGAFLQEEHNFYIDQQSLAWAHLIFTQIGRHLVTSGAIDSPDDIFMLKVDEVRALLLTPDHAKAQAIRALVAERRAGMEQARSLTPPPFLGPPPEAPPDNVMGRTNTRFFGGPPQVADAPDQLKGAAGSRGVATGSAFVAHSLDEAKAIAPGQILIAMTTMPAWTPFFGVAAAVVTETGGPLSHCAIVAREYGIPAVVGAHGATRAISTGQIITVDGDRGIVMLSAEPA